MCIISVVSDVQVGHEAALWPDGFKNHILYPWQEKLMEYWYDFWTCDYAKDSEYVINLAESIEGNNRKENGINLVDVNLNHQKDAFVKLLSPYIKGKKYIGLNGSKYHTSIDYNVEEQIAKDLDGEFMGDIANMKFPTGHVVWATHKAGDAMLYKSTMLDRNSLYFSAIKSKLDDDIDLALYGHHHQLFGTETATRRSIIAPAWKFWHPIKGASKFPYTQPTIGGIFIILPKKREQLEIKKKTYKLEHIYSAIRKM